METKKLIIIVAISCVLLGVSVGAAMAEGCGDGVIENETFEGNLVITNELSCTIISSTIKGNLRVRDTKNVLLLNNKVGGSIRVILTEPPLVEHVANVIANTVFSGNLVVKDYDIANVIENETVTGKEGRRNFVAKEYDTANVIENETFREIEGKGNIRVIGNTNALVQKNIAAHNLICRNTNTDAFLNVARNKLDCGE